MEVGEIIWLYTFVEKLWRKHHVRIEEVEEVLSGRPRVRMVARGNVAGEDVYSAMGKTTGGRYSQFSLFSRLADGHWLLAHVI